jgi:hypothetical protein
MKIPIDIFLQMVYDYTIFLEKDTMVTEMAKDEQFVQVMQHALDKAQAEQKLTVAELMARLQKS